MAIVNWVEKKALPRKVAETDLCLGAFGTTPQSMMTVQNKIYEGLALRKCVVTGDSPAVSKTLTHDKHVWLCERANRESLAQAILTLKGDPDLREALADSGHRFFVKNFTVAALGKQFKHHLQTLTQSS